MKKGPDIWNAWASQRIRDCTWWLVVYSKTQASHGAAQSVSTERCLERMQVLQRVWRRPPEISSARQLKVNTCAAIGRWIPPLPAGWDTLPQHLKTPAEPETRLGRTCKCSAAFFESVTRLKGKQSWLLWSRACSKEGFARREEVHWIDDGWHSHTLLIRQNATPSLRPLQAAIPHESRSSEAFCPDLEVSLCHFQNMFVKVFFFFVHLALQLGSLLCFC